MLSAAFEILRLEIPRTQLVEIFGTQASELIQTLMERHLWSFEAFAVEGIEGSAFAILQDDFRARHPVVAFAVDQVTERVAGAPGVFAFARLRPCFGQVAQKCIEGGGCAGEQRNCVLQVMFHGLGTM